MALPRGPKPGTVNNPKGINQYGIGKGSKPMPGAGSFKQRGSTAVTAAPSVSSGIQKTAASASPTKVKFGLRSRVAGVFEKGRNKAVSARNSVADRLAKRKSGKYASGTGDKSKQGLGYKMTRLRIKHRSKTRGLRTGAAKVQDSARQVKDAYKASPTYSGGVKNAATSVRNQAKAAYNKRTSGKGTGEMTLRKRLSNTVGRLRRDKL